MFTLFALLGCAATAPADRATDVLFLSVDTTRPDALGFFGGAAETPNIDALLGESLVMARHHSGSGWTYPSMVCATSGRSALDMGYALLKETLPPIPADERLPTDALGEAGWRAKLISTNSYLGPMTGSSSHYGDYEELRAADADAVVDDALQTIAAWAPTLQRARALSATE